MEEGESDDDDDEGDDDGGDYASMRGSQHDHRNESAKMQKAKGSSDSSERSAARAIALARAVCAHIDLLDALALAADFLGHAALQSMPVAPVPVVGTAGTDTSSSATKRRRGANFDDVFDEARPTSSSSSSFASSSSFSGETATFEPPPTAEMLWATDIQAGIDSLFGTSLSTQHDLIRRAFGAGGGEKGDGYSKIRDRTAAAASSPSSSSAFFSSSSSSFSSSSPSSASLSVPVDEDADDSASSSADRPLHGAYHLPVALLAWACQVHIFLI